MGRKAGVMKGTENRSTMGPKRGALMEMGKQ